MSKRPDNVRHLSEFNDEGGYRLPNGNLLTQDLALLIGENVGLFMGGGLSIEDKMACEKRYVLPDGELLNKEQAIKFAAAEGVTFDETLSSEELEAALLSYYGEACKAMLRPYYIPMICHSPPRPPMLIFSLNCSARSRNSEYTINLNSLWPTGNSPIQTEVPYKIKAMLR
jgi:hypothetical protein